MTRTSFGLMFDGVKQTECPKCHGPKLPNSAVCFNCTFAKYTYEEQEKLHVRARYLSNKLREPKRKPDKLAYWRCYNKKRRRARADFAASQEERRKHALYENTRRRILDPGLDDRIAARKAKREASLAAYETRVKELKAKFEAKLVEAGIKKAERDALLARKIWKSWSAEQAERRAKRKAYDRVQSRRKKEALKSPEEIQKTQARRERRAYLASLSPEQRKAEKKAYTQKHNYEAYWKNLESNRARVRAWRLENKERLKARSSAWYRDNKKLAREINQVWQSKNRKNLTEKQREVSRNKKLLRELTTAVTNLKQSKKNQNRKKNRKTK